MCGISLYYQRPSQEQIYVLQHRGPDSTTLKEISFRKERLTLIFHHLSITGFNNFQPFYKDGVFVIANGEIYNHKELAEELKLSPTTDSDCEVILHLYFLQKLYLLDGEFAYIIIDTIKEKIYYSRDKYGVRPLFISSSGLSSELKGIKNGVQVEPGKLFERTDGLILKGLCPERDHRVVLQSLKKGEIPSIIRYINIKESLIRSVKKRINTQSKIGFLLSGGLDSSLVLSITCSLYEKRTIDVFTCGFTTEATDVVASKKVITYLEDKYPQIKFNHHIVIFSIEEGLKAIPEVIKSIESFDTTTVRASTPMWLLCKYIKEKTDVKVLLSGEGSDEVNGGYLYFHYAPTREEFDKERQRLVDNIHFFDGLRADRCVSAHSLELRVPFLDEDYVESSLTESKIYDRMIETKVEKMFLRELFIGYLPDELLFRTKEAFSDATSTLKSSWKASIMEYTKNIKNLERDYEKTKRLYSIEHLPPVTEEQMWYRTIFNKLYSNPKVIPYMWMPKWTDATDPSATVLKIFEEKIK